MAKVTDTKEHEKFCQKDGWELATKKGKHKKYRKQDANGHTKMTVISHAYKEYSPALFKRILEQLEVTKDEYFKVIGKE